MCGIVGYWGPLNPKDVIINGLRKLEYRGYDSAGIAVIHDQKLKRVRAEGKLKNLEEKLTHETFNGHLGIGHTRWATHGVPSERNAHPHQVKDISIVHNGIIENYMEIKEALIEKGAKLTSDTDSELVAHLLADEIEKTQDLFKAVLIVLKKLRGSFSILVIWEKKPNQLIAFKDGPPLVVGLGKEQVFVVSDIQAALEHTKKFVYLDDREIVFANGHEISFFNQSGEKIEKPVVEINWNAELVEKKGFSHFMLKEIFEQPQAIASAAQPHIDSTDHTVKLKNLGFSGVPPQNLDQLDSIEDFKVTSKTFSEIKKISIIACGTSFYAGLVGKYLIESLARISVEVDIASEFRYRNPIFDKGHLVITISQSGETADTLAAIRLAKEKGAKTLSICNVKNSSIDREAHGHLYMNCGPEIGVASTKAFVSTLTILNLLALSLGKSNQQVSQQTETEWIQALLALPSQVETVLTYDKYFSEAAESLKSFKGFLYMGRGVQYPIAMEGALKLKELAYLHAEGYAAGEMKHGPLALIDKNMAIIMLAPSDEHYEKTVSNLEEAKARGGKIISIGTGENKRLKQTSDRYLALPKAHWSTNPILSVVPLQLMAFHLASSLGCNVDQPRNLAKSVTVE
jgi:glucosamine--fructose-6-phosphate aminotransferase (isomerizing)